MKHFSSMSHLIVLLSFSSMALLPEQVDQAAFKNHFPVAAEKTVINNDGVIKGKLVKIYPDQTKKSVYVLAKETNGFEIDFYTFDLEGTLIKHFRMKKGDRKEIKGLEKGKYVYSVFSGDEETDRGEFDIH